MLFLLFALLLSCADDEFHCSYSDLSRALPRLKVVLKSENYDKLQTLHDKLNDAFVKPRPPDNKQIGSMISALVTEQERLLCFAVIQVKYGMLSVTDPFIARYLELDQDAIVKIRQLNNGCLIDIKQLVSKLPEALSGGNHSALMQKARSRYQDGLLELKKKLTPKQLGLFDTLFASFDHDRVVVDLISTLSGDQLRAAAIAKGYSKAHPNIQLQMKAKGLLLMDHKIAREFLELSPEQDKTIILLYQDYKDAVDELQMSLSAALLKEPTVETTRIHRQKAMKLNESYLELFMNLLTKNQQMLLEKLLCQVIGYKYCQTSPVKEQIGITEEQARRSLAFGVKCMEEFNEKRNASDCDYEKDYRFARYYSERVKNEMLTAEQREKWEAFIGKKIPEQDLMILQKDYVKRTAHYVLPINPKTKN